jgi:hypothetical protein
MLEKITDRKFASGKVLNDEQSQQIFGGKFYSTIFKGGRDGWHFDTWNDWDENGLSADDILDIYMTVPPPDHGHGGDPVNIENSVEELAELGVKVSFL